MPNLAITASQVLAGEDAKIINAEVGVAVVPGQAVFYEEESSSWKLGTATNTLASGRVEGITLATGAVGARVGIQTDGKIIVGLTAAPAKGTIYILGATAGSIAPSSDAATTWNVTIIGFGDGAGGIELIFNASDLQVP